ncbi:MAG: TRAP transporter substrate-binding protein [Methylobacteriaceae bacterium]|nr:TRAP transporter substrate-binding protein [Methylobacteriaceae bacterium]
MFFANARLTTVFALLAILSAGGVEAKTFRAADIQAEDYPTVQAIRFMNDRLVQRTNGRHRIAIFPARQLGEEEATIEQTRAGAIDIDRISIGPLAAFIPQLRVLSLPFLFRSNDHFHKVLDGEIGEQILASFEPQGFVGLTYYDSGARSLYNRLRPVRTLADLKGMKIRIQQSEIAAELVRALGAEPVVLAYGQVLTGLSTGLIDGAENNWPSYVTTDHYRAAPFYTLTEHTMLPEVLIMSKKAWDGLSPEDRAVFREVARESAKFMRRQWEAWEEQARNVAESNGVKVVSDADRAPFIEATKPIYDRVLSDQAARDLADRIRQVQ